MDNGLVNSSSILLMLRARSEPFFSVCSEYLHIVSWWLIVPADGNNCDTHLTSIHYIHSSWFYFLDACIYDEDSVQRVLYTVQHGHHVCSHTWSHPDLTTLNWDQSQYQTWSLVLYTTHNILVVHNEMWLIERKYFSLPYIHCRIHHHLLRFRGPPEDCWCLSSLHATTYALRRCQLIEQPYWFGHW